MLKIMCKGVWGLTFKSLNKISIMYTFHINFIEYRKVQRLISYLVESLSLALALSCIIARLCLKVQGSMPVCFGAVS